MKQVKVKNAHYNAIDGRFSLIFKESEDPIYVQDSSIPTISSPYGVRDLEGLETQSTFHHGIDLRLHKNTLLAFGCDVKIEAVGESDSCGKFIALWTMPSKGNSKRVFLCHLNDIKVKAYEIIEPGTIIASTGNTGKYTTGPHLHLGVRNNLGGVHSRFNLSYTDAANVGYEDPILSLKIYNADHCDIVTKDNGTQTIDAPFENLIPATYFMK